MKKFIIACMSLIYLVGCSGGSSSSMEETRTYSLYLDVELEDNILFSTYDVDIYFDDDKLGKVKQGKYFTQLLENLSEETHYIEFKKANEISPSKSMKVKMNSDKTIKLKLKAHNNSIEIKDEETTNSIKESKITVPDVTNTLLSDATEELEDAGFLNVSYKTDSNETVWVESNWTVISQSVEPNKDVDKNTEIVLTCKSNDDLEAENEITEEPEVENNNEENSEEEKTITKNATNGLQIMKGTSLAMATSKAAEFGVVETYCDDFDDGTSLQQYSNSSGGLMLSVMYWRDSEEIIYGNIVTNKAVSKAKQLEFINGMAPVLCPSSDVESVVNWVNSNADGDTSTEIGGFKYEVSHGPVNNALYYSGYKTWENWWMAQQ